MKVQESGAMELVNLKDFEEMKPRTVKVHQKMRMPPRKLAPFRIKTFRRNHKAKAIIKPRREVSNKVEGQCILRITSLMEDAL